MYLMYWSAGLSIRREEDGIKGVYVVFRYFRQLGVGAYFLLEPEYNEKILPRPLEGSATTQSAEEHSRPCCRNTTGLFSFSLQEIIEELCKYKI